jgi:hypothetical protein
VRLTGRLDGLQQMHRALRRIAEPSELEASLKAGAEDIRAAARAGLGDGLPPDSRTGALAASLSVEMAEGGTSARIGTGLDYGWHLEFGTLTRPATPWLEPALDEARPGILARLKRWLAGSGRR